MQGCLEEATTSHPGPTVMAHVISWDTWQEHSGAADPRLAMESSPHSVSLLPSPDRQGMSDLSPRMLTESNKHLMLLCWPSQDTLCPRNVPKSLISIPFDFHHPRKYLK